VLCVCCCLFTVYVQFPTRRLGIYQSSWLLIDKGWPASRMHLKWQLLHVAHTPCKASQGWEVGIAAAPPCRAMNVKEWFAVSSSRRPPLNDVNLERSKNDLQSKIVGRRCASMGTPTPMKFCRPFRLKTETIVLPRSSGSRISSAKAMPRAMIPMSWSSEGTQSDSNPNIRLQHYSWERWG
jgi:hypothetical protein